MRVIRSYALGTVLALQGSLFVSASADAPPVDNGKAGVPVVEFLNPTYNFGKVKSGEVVKCDFVFTNAGTAALQITAVKPGCGCTTAGLWDKQVEPGKTGRIPLQFNSTGFGGQLSKSATVTCNDPVRSNITLHITGTVWKPIDITPAMAMFMHNTETPTNETKVLRIVNNLDESITLSDLKCNNSSFITDLKETKPGKEFELMITAVPPFTNPTVYASITLKTSSTNAPMINVSASVIVQQAVTVNPQQVMIPAGPLKMPSTSTVQVRNNSTNALALSDVRLNIPGVEVRTTEPVTGRVYSVSMTFPVGFQVEPGQKMELAMRSSHPKFPEIKVPVVQMQPVKAAAGPAAVGAGFGGGSSPGPGLLQPASPIVPKPARQGLR